MQQNFDVLIIGAGAAGLTLALSLPKHYSIGILCKGALLDSSSTYWAQGGISAVLESYDSFQSHIDDTLAAGAGLCDIDAVSFTVKGAPAVIHWLQQLGMPFTEDAPAHLHLTREGGHSHRRVVHSDDATGQALQTTLVAQLKSLKNVQIFENAIGIDLIIDPQSQQCLGAYYLDIGSNSIFTAAAKVSVLATGGANKVYLYSSNPHNSTGDGIAMAWRAGADIGNMEFMQFHPTCLYHPKDRTFLISEAVRGEGGILRLPDGEAFMQRYHPSADLAPRDIVARAIDSEMKRHGIKSVFLDITHKDADFLHAHFPTIYQHCLQLGLDMTRDWLPVVPAAHYTCGGVATDLNGQSSVAHLYALGETAYTGLHGANRMASNSLLECMVFAKSASEDICQKIDAIGAPPQLPPWDDSQVIDSDEAVVLAHNWDELRRTMWDYVGIVRTDKRLQRAVHRIDLLSREIHEYYGDFLVTRDLVELRNLCQVAKLIVQSASTRCESRGLHFTPDYPQMGQNPKPTILNKNRDIGSV